jgi:hypothetical protein
MAGRNKRKILGRMLQFSIIIALIFSMVSFAVEDSKGNGGGVGDLNREYDCGGSCHNTPVQGTIAMTASTINPIASQTITVTIDVTQDDLGSSEVIGVFLLKELSVDGSQPCDDGWTIVSDPNGGMNNYVERDATCGEKEEFTWTLKVPSTPGTYHLFARGQFGPGTGYNDETTGLVFQVVAAPSGTPVVDHTPIKTAYTNNEIKVDASVTNAQEVDLYWRNGSEENFTALSMTKVSEDGDGKWTFTASIPALEEEGILEYYIEAENGVLVTTTPTARITVTEQPAIPSIMAWGIQIVIILEIAGFVAYFVTKILAKNGKISQTNGRNRNG